MAVKSIKSILAEAGLASPDQLVEWTKAWRAATENGAQEPLLEFFSREAGVSSEVFLERLAQALGWPNAQIGWSDVVALANDTQGWASKGHPEWGKFTLGKTNPNVSTSGLAATI